MPAAPPPPPTAKAPKRSAAVRHLLERFLAKKGKVAPEAPPLPPPAAPAAPKKKTLGELRAEARARKKREELAKPPPPKKTEAKVVEVMPRGYRQLRERLLKRKLKKALLAYIEGRRADKEMREQMDFILEMQKEIEELEREGLRKEGVAEEFLPDLPEEVSADLYDFLKLRAKESRHLYSKEKMREDIDFWSHTTRHILDSMSDLSIAKKVGAYNRGKPDAEKIVMRDDEDYNPLLLFAIRRGDIKL